MKKIIRSGLYGGNQIQRINFQWFITNQCNSKCHYCNIYDNNNTDLTIEQNINIVDKLLQVYPNYRRSFVFLGGEPTTYDGLDIVLQHLISNKLFNDSICVFTNGSENMNTFEDKVVNGFFDNVYMIFSYHSDFPLAYMLEDKLDLLIQHNIPFRVSIMVFPFNIDKIQKFYKKYEIYHNDKFIFECVPIEQMNIYNKVSTYIEYIKFCKKVNNMNKSDKIINVFYDILDTETNVVTKEIYTQSDMKLLPDFYFQFQNMICYTNYRISITNDGCIMSFCDFMNEKKYEQNLLTLNVQNIENWIDQKNICDKQKCTNNDVSILYKERID